MAQETLDLLYTWLDNILQTGRHEEFYYSYKPMVSAPIKNVYMEKLEESQNKIY